MKSLSKPLLFLLVTLSSTVSVEALYQAIEKHPETELGEKAYASGNYDEAIEHFQKAIDAGEKRGEPHFFIGAIKEYRREYSDAIPYYVAALEHELTDELRKIALWKLVILYRNERNYTEMLTYIEQLEETGVSHKNFESFKEEAEKNLTPSKRESYRCLQEIREILRAFQQENPDAEFWDLGSNRENVLHVLELYERAIELDEERFALNWELAGYY